MMLDKNYGFCRAVNIGIEKTDTPYVILLNNDTVIKDNYVKVSAGFDQERSEHIFCGA